MIYIYLDYSIGGSDITKVTHYIILLKYFSKQKGYIGIIFVT